MFSQRKSFWRSRWFVLVIVALVGIGYWINQSANSEITDPPDHTTGLNTQTGEDTDINRTPDPDTEEYQETDIVVSDNTPYFLIKEKDKAISIYYCDESGEETFVRNTDIAYSLLSEADQTLFSKGIIVKTEEELEELLQDFGS